MYGVGRISILRKNQTLPAYFHSWMEMYKKGAVAKVTYRKYEMTYQKLNELASDVTLGSLNRLEYQRILNVYAQTHEHQTVMDFHHQVKSALLDVVDEGIISKDPTRKVVIKGTTTRTHKVKYLNQHELQLLLSVLELNDEINWDYLILLVAKTGMRFAEALGLTPNDIDFNKQLVTINKTWNYKYPEGGFAPTKNKSSERKIRIDWMLCMQLKRLTSESDLNKPIFVTQQRVFNATVNEHLKSMCNKVNIPIISMHGLRHTHASLLLFAGVSVASVARRLGHANMTTTQNTYLHVIKELENQDTDRVMQYLSTLQ